MSPLFAWDVFTASLGRDLEVPDAVLAGLVTLLVWTGQLVGLATIGSLAWPPELWAGVVLLTVLLAAVLTRLLQPRVTASRVPSSRVLNNLPLPLHRSAP